MGSISHLERGSFNRALSFLSPTALAVRTFKSSKVRKCQTCGKVYSGRHATRSLRRHVRFECNVAPQFACVICGRAFRRKEAMRHHSLTQHSEMFAGGVINDTEAVSILPFLLKPPGGRGGTDEVVGSTELDLSDGPGGDVSDNLEQRPRALLTAGSTDAN